MSVRLLGRPDARDRVGFVYDQGRSIRVRYRLKFDDDPTAWRCDSCGSSQFPACRHAKAVADIAITQINGLIDALRVQRSRATYDH